MDAVTITSSEGLRNLYEMIGDSGRAWLRKTPLFVSHERIAESARKLGFAQVIPTAAGDDGLMEGLLNYFRPDGPGVRGENYASTNPSTNTSAKP
jgi:uroporphyrinogen-III synthase